MYYNKASNSKEIGDIFRYILDAAVKQPKPFDYSKAYFMDMRYQSCTIGTFVEEWAEGAIKKKLGTYGFETKDLAEILKDYQDKFRKGETLDKGIFYILFKLEEYGKLSEDLFNLKFPAGTESQQRLETLRRDNPQYSAPRLPEAQPTLPTSTKKDKLIERYEKIALDLIKVQNTCKKKDKEIIILKKESLKLNPQSRDVDRLEKEILEAQKKERQDSSSIVSLIPPLTAQTKIQLIESCKSIELAWLEADKSCKAKEQEISKLKAENSVKTTLVYPQAVANSRESSKES